MLRSTCLALLIFAGIASADVQNGIVRYQGQTIPGATVTAECGKDTDKITTVTDDSGRFEMGGLPSTSCKYTILLFGFQPLQKDATASATPLTFDLSMQEGAASIPVAPNAAPVVTSAAPAPARATPAPAQAAAPNLGQMPSLTGGNGRGGQTGRGNQANARGGQNANRGGGYQALSLTQNADTTASDAPASLLGGDNGGTGSGASDAFTVNGTLSQGVQAQAGDGMGMGGPGGFGFGPGGPGGFGGPGGPGGPGGDFGGGGRGGPGGPGGGGPGGGGRGGPGGGQGFQGGPGGGGPGGPGGFGGGPGGGGPGGGGFGGGPGGGGRGGGGRGPNGVTAFGNRAGRGRGPQWQASIVYNFANSALNARPYSFASETTTPVKAATANNSLGFTLGGPIMIPKTKLNLKNSRWNLNVTGMRNRVGIDDISSVPSGAMRTGDFSSLLGTTTIIDPTNGQPFTGNIIQPNRLSPAALALLSAGYIPGATGSGLLNNYQLIANNPSNNNNINLQISDPITTKDRININLSRQSRQSDQVQAFGYRDPTNGWGGNLSVAYSRTITTTTVNTLTFSSNRNVTNSCSYFSTPGLNPSFCPQSSSLEAPSISFQNFTGPTDNTPSTNHSTQFGVSDSVAKSKGKHNMQFGITTNKRYTNSLTATNARGQYSFSSVNPDGTGYDFADFMLGLPSGASGNQYLNGDDNFYYRQFNTAVFFNDDYRLSTNFTLNGGLRWEYYTPETEKYNHMANVDIASNGLSATIVAPGDIDPYTGQTTPSGLIHGDWKMYEPQIGFAYKPWAKRPIVFRGGYGIRYNGGALQTQGGKLAIQPPFVNTVSLTSTTTPGLPLLLAGPTAAATGEISNTYALAPNYVPARAQQWNAIAQYTFLRSYVFQLSYFGTKGSNLDVLLGPNRDTPIAGQKVGSPGPISYMSSTIQLDESIGSSIFHSGQAQLTRRFARGLSGGATYSLQKSIDDSSTLGGGVVQIENNLLAERALSPGIPRQTLSVNFNYQTLAGNQRSEFYWNIIRGWQLFGGYNLTSGSPFTATIPGDVSGTGIIGSARAEATGLPVEDGSGYFNPAAFAVPADGTYGDAGRDTIPGIWNFTMNASAMRSFRIGERRRLALTFSTQNPLNHPSITGISTVIGSQTLVPGTPTSAGGMRTVTAQARFTF